MCMGLHICSHVFPCHIVSTEKAKRYEISLSQFLLICSLRKTSLMKCSRVLKISMQGEKKGSLGLMRQLLKIKLIIY